MKQRYAWQYSMSDTRAFRGGVCDGCLCLDGGLGEVLVWHDGVDPGRIVLVVTE